MIHYIIISYILFPFTFSLGIYIVKKKEKQNEYKFPYWYILKQVLGDFYKGEFLIVFLLSPIMLPHELFYILRDLSK